MYVHDLARLPEPVSESMLIDREQRTLTLRVMSVTADPKGREVPGDALVVTNEAWGRYPVKTADLAASFSTTVLTSSFVSYKAIVKTSSRKADVVGKGFADRSTCHSRLRSVRRDPLIA